MSNVLFDEYQLGSISLKNRIVMAPMTRARSTQPGDVPNELMAEYYGQRASAGLIISEATYISPQGKGTRSRRESILMNRSLVGRKLRNPCTMLEAHFSTAMARWSNEPL